MQVVHPLCTHVLSHAVLKNTKKQAEECDFFLLKLHSALRIAALFAYTPLQGEGK